MELEASIWWRSGPLRSEGEGIELLHVACAPSFIWGGGEKNVSLESTDVNVWNEHSSIFNVGVKLCIFFSWALAVKLGQLQSDG